jgi:TRAP-type C4-dicarboxylate transport system permease small subunit
MRKRPSIIELSVAALMLTLVVLVFAQVMVRYLTYQPLAWSEEAARYAFIWLCLLGAVVAAQRGQHFVVDYAQRALPAKLYRFTATATQLLATLFYALLAAAGLKTLTVVHFQQSSSLEIPMSISYLAIPVGALLLAAVSIRQAWSIWFQKLD